MIILLLLFGSVIVIAFTFILFVQQNLIDLKSTPILAIGLYQGSPRELNRVRDEFEEDHMLKKISRQYFVLVYRSEDQTKIEVFGGNLKKTEYQELRKLLA